MPIPKYFEMHKPFLEFLKDGKLHSMNDLKVKMAEYFVLNEKDLAELLPSGRKVFSNRIGWASTYLKKAGLIDSPNRAMFVITKQGLKVLRNNPAVIDNDYLMQFDSFREFQNASATKDKKPIYSDTEQDTTPDDTFEESFRVINNNLADELLNEVAKLSCTAFEQMVIDLLSSMGYGAFENSGKLTAVSGDEGIDGIIMEDKLGFSLIYIQAKRWELNRTVGRPDVQSFVGAISGKGGKGLFVTTAKFSKQAIDYAKQQHIILIDGQKLARLMIEHNFAVTVKKTFEIKAIDTDVFNDYMD